ncbi:hypothetical protein ACFV4K_28315 [Nocardia sp. NPDC059764]|uniref:hypothetical protein n=1 Tax=Nocardia sp. NPDC059764 TaxID=3346939 RepID=UPI00364AB549
MAVFATVQLQAYQSVFPNAATRAAALAPLVDNGALRALYGYPYDIADPTGWVAWRSMTSIGIIMAVWAVIITTGALRGEEDAGRGELALAAPQPRNRWFAAALTATTLETLTIGVVAMVSLAVVGVPQHLLAVSNSLELGLQLMLPALLFTAVAAVTSQLVNTVRAARLIAIGILVTAFIIRVPADTGNGVGWLRWVTPLGWIEELAPPATPSVPALALSLGATVLLVLAALPMLAARDVGLGILSARDSRPPRRLLLGTSWQAALRDEAPQLAIWALAVAFYMGLLGALIKTVFELMQRTPMLGRMFGERFAVDGFVAAAFSMTQLIVALLVVTLLVAARGEESTGRLELVLAMPCSRTGWLGGRILLAATVALAAATLAAVSIWVGAAITGERVRVNGLAAAAANTIPLIVITTGFTAAILALWPRAVAFTYGVVAAMYLWDALGTALKAPEWSLKISPFHAVPRVPLQQFTITPAAVLTLSGLALITLSLWAFRRRDLVTG